MNALHQSSFNLRIDDKVLKIFQGKSVKLLTIFSKGSTICNYESLNQIDSY